MVINKEIIDNQFYLYMNGKLIYKRWLDTGQSLVFDVMAYNKYTSVSIRDPYQNKTAFDFIIIMAKLKMKSAEQGGRKSGIFSGYRPNHVFEYKANNTFSSYVGDIQFDGQRAIEPGEEKLVTVRFLNAQPIEQYLTIGRKWWIHEGANQLGEAEILSVTFR
jgi:hypothetical protein